LDWFQIIDNKLGLILAIVVDKAIGVADTADELNKLVVAKDHDHEHNELVMG
jgi:hypothetical protein